MLPKSLLSGVKDLNILFQSFRAVYTKQEAAFERGLKRSGLLYLARSQEQVPVDKGFLKASGFVRAENSGFKTRVILGYTQNYAIYVHENLDAAHGADFNQLHADAIAAGKEHTRGVGQKAKFLEDPIRDDSNRLLVMGYFKEEFAR